MIASVFLYFAKPIFAQTLYKERPFFQASRALAMGDAYTAYNSDFEAVYYNPAGLAKVNELQIKPFDIEGIGSHDFAMFFKNIFTDLRNITPLMENIRQNQGKPYSVGVNLLPQFLVKNFSFGFLGRSFAEGVSLENSNLQLYSFTEVGGYLHTAFSLFGGVIKIGGGVKFLDRAELSKEYTPAEYLTELKFQNEWKEGLGVGYDAGLMLTVPITFLPTLAVSVQDIGNTRFQSSTLLFKNNHSSDSPPHKIRQRINTGFAMKLKHGRTVSSAFTFDIKDLAYLNKETGDRSASDHLHGGWEMNVRKILFLRAGINQGRYWTAGFGLHVGGMALEFTSYGENVAFKDQARINDRKYVGRYAIMF